MNNRFSYAKNNESSDSPLSSEDVLELLAKHAKTTADTFESIKDMFVPIMGQLDEHKVKIFQLQREINSLRSP